MVSVDGGGCAVPEAGLVAGTVVEGLDVGEQDGAQLGALRALLVEEGAVATHNDGRNLYYEVPDRAGYLYVECLGFQALVNDPVEAVRMLWAPDEQGLSPLSDFLHTINVVNGVVWVVSGLGAAACTVVSGGICVAFVGTFAASSKAAPLLGLADAGAACLDTGWETCQDQAVATVVMVMMGRIAVGGNAMGYEGSTGVANTFRGISWFGAVLRSAVVETRPGTLPVVRVFPGGQVAL